MQETNFRQEAVFVVKQYFKVIKMLKWEGGTKITRFNRRKWLPN